MEIPETALRNDDTVFLMGEEVAEYQGAYKVSKGLLDEFGSRRVGADDRREHERYRRQAERAGPWTARGRGAVRLHVRRPAAIAAAMPANVSCSG